MKSARTHENSPNPRFADPEKLENRADARTGSDLQELIATTTIRAFNQGVDHGLRAQPGSFKNVAFDTGRIYERDQLLGLAREASIDGEHGRFVYLADLEDYIKFRDQEERQKSA